MLSKFVNFRKEEEVDEKPTAFYYQVSVERHREGLLGDSITIALKVWNRCESIVLKPLLLSCHTRDIEEGYYGKIFNEIISRTQEGWEEMAKEEVVKYLNKNRKNEELNRILEEINNNKGSFILEEEDYE